MKFTSHTTASTKLINGSSGLVVIVLFLVGLLCLCARRKVLPIRPRYLPGVILMLLGWLLLMVIEVIKDLFGDFLICGPYLTSEIFFFNLFLFGMLFRFVHVYAYFHLETAAAQFHQDGHTKGCETRFFSKLLYGNKRKKCTYLLLCILALSIGSMAYPVTFFAKNIELAFASATSEDCDTAEHSFDAYVTYLHASLVLLIAIVGQRLSNVRENFRIKQELLLLALWSLLVIADHWAVVFVPTTYIKDFNSKHFFKYIFPSYFLLAITILYPLCLIKRYKQISRKHYKGQRSMETCMISYEFSENPMKEVEYIICDPELSLMFKDFMIAEFTVEHFLFIEAVCEYHHVIKKDPEKAMQMMDEIIKRFLRQSAPLLVNISHKMRKKVMDHANEILVPDPFIFRSVQGAVLKLISLNNLSRFKSTKLFLEVVRSSANRLLK